MYDWISTLRTTRCKLIKNGDKKASEIDIKQILPKLSNEISIQKRKLNNKYYLNCFIGSSVVDWMLLNLELESRSEGVILGKKLLKEGFIQALIYSEFVDEYTAYYQFLKME